jgi:hypothetical protein
MEVIAVGLDAALDQFSVLGDDANHAGDFTQIESDEAHVDSQSRATDNDHQSKLPYHHPPLLQPIYRRERSSWNIPLSLGF